MTPWLTECPDPARWIARLDAGAQPNEDGCLVWTGTLDTYGYGRWRWSDGGRLRNTSAARAAWLARRGPLPTGYVPDHLCRNRACVNVDHMETVTLAENTRRGIVTGNARGPYRRRELGEHFPCGHPRSPENSYTRTYKATGSVSYFCVECARANQRRWRERRRSAA